ncbi:MAG TPA: glycosyltransferase family 4 protein [Thermoanaerobaculia bacterium]|nr:glycosyltransferase family 4 protein [Thermoanaerobaculia bacterium]
MPRVLFLSQAHHAGGGMEQWLHNFALWLQEQPGWDVRLALPRGRQFNDPEAFTRVHPGLQTLTLDVRVGTASARTAAVVRAIEEFDADLLLPIGSGAAFPGVAEAKRRGAKVRFVVPVRGIVPELMANIVEQWPVVDGVVSISRLLDTFFRETLPDHERVHYVRHGAKAATAPHVDAPRLRAGFVGRLEPIQKRVLDLIPFAQALPENVELHVYGDGPEEARLRAALPNAIFHGRVTQEQLYATGYPNLDVLLLFSVVEGTPNAVVEALHHAIVPVISRYLGQTGERFVVDGRNGFTFDVGDTATAAHHVTSLANDRARLRALSEQARADVANETAERMHRDWLRIFEKTLALPQKRGALTLPPEESGRLERLIPPPLADRLRALFHRYYPHPDGWSEWPGSIAADPARVTAIDETLHRIDREERARVYTAAP